MREILKKVSIVIVIFVMIINVGCTKNNDIGTSSNTIESEEEFISFEEAIEISEVAVNAEFIAYLDKGDFVEYEFKIKEVLYGDVPETNIYIFSMKGTSHVEETDFTYNIGNDKYIIGDEYLLIMEKNDSLFYEHVRYMLVTNIFIPLKNIQGSTMYEQSIAVKDEDTLNSNDKINNYVKGIKNSSKNIFTPDKEGASYTESDDMKTIVSEADLVLEVTIEDLKVEGLVHNGNTYTCDVSDIIKGDSLEKGEDGKILVTFLKGSVEVSGKYVVMINKVGEDSIIYTQSSKNSVIPVDDKKLLNEISSYIQE
ncbi:hypothetical protein EBB07_23815 [Paenibacillaceae bacterium]|nr:hypothetical protein EBB07_23815 [Paenibacillaceae bacterium]